MPRLLGSSFWMEGTTLNQSMKQTIHNNPFWALHPVGVRIVILWWWIYYQGTGASQNAARTAAFMCSLTSGSTNKPSFHGNPANSWTHLLHSDPISMKTHWFTRSSNGWGHAVTGPHCRIRGNHSCRWYGWSLSNANDKKLRILTASDLLKLIISRRVAPSPCPRCVADLKSVKWRRSICLTKMT